MEQLKQLLTAAGIAYKENEPLAAHCTFKIGGPARLFVQPADRAQLCRAVALCKAQGVRYYLLGNGSNILFADEGYNGVVLDISSMQDAEGCAVMQELGRNMAWLLRCIEAGKAAGIDHPQNPPRPMTNFIR